MLENRRDINNYRKNVIILYKGPMYYNIAQDDKIS